MEQMIIRSYMNIGMQGIAVIFMIILLVSLILQKKKTVTTKYLISLIVMEIVILGNQIFQWTAEIVVLRGWIFLNNKTMGGMLWSLDFTLMYAQMILFYVYVCSYIEEVRKREGDKRKIPKGILIALIVWGALNCALFASSIWTHSMYYFDEFGMGHYTGSLLYKFVFRSGTVNSIACLIIIIKNRKKLEWHYCAVLISYLLARYIMLPIDIKYSFSFSYIFLAIELFVIYLGIDRRMNEELAEKEVELANHQLELEKKNAQIMVSQIQPHFLYNTLSVIDYLCGQDVELARTAINHFSEYLRMNMESVSSSVPVSFKKELEHTKTYLWIEKMRFSDILDIEYDIKFADFEIPPLTLQPLCENAVKHGVRGKENGGTVRISTEKVGNKVIIRVEDDGIGFETDIAPGTDRIHVGIENVSSRLKSMCDGTLTIESRIGIGTTATIEIELPEEK